MVSGARLNKNLRPESDSDFEGDVRAGCLSATFFRDGLDIKVLFEYQHVSVLSMFMSSICECVFELYWCLCVESVIVCVCVYVICVCL